jgi:hypothetical protein
MVGFAGKNRYFFKKSTCKRIKRLYTKGGGNRGRSSVVERHVANVNVVSSNLIARFYTILWVHSIGELPANYSLALVSDTFKPLFLRPKLSKTWLRVLSLMPFLFIILEIDGR